MMMALFPTLEGAARPITTPITTYHIKHAPATSHKNQVNSLYNIISCWQPASQELRQREAANTLWRSPVRASAPFGLRRGAGANTVGVVVVVALVVIAHFAPRPPSACNWRCHLLPPLLLPCVQHLTQYMYMYSSRFALYPS